MANRWGNNGDSDRLYFRGLQSHCRWWLQPWNEKILDAWKKSLTNLDIEDIVWKSQTTIISFLLCVLHHVDISCHMVTVICGVNSKCLILERDWWTKSKLPISKRFLFHLLSHEIYVKNIHTANYLGQWNSSDWCDLGKKLKNFWVGIFLCHFQFSSVTQSCLILCNPMDYSTPGFPVHHQLPELTQNRVHRVSDAIQQSHPLSSPSPPTFNLSQHQGLFKWVTSSHQVAKIWSFSFSISPSNE